jgi:hypothetical protein
MKKSILLALIMLTFQISVYSQSVDSLKIVKLEEKNEALKRDKEELKKRLKLADSHKDTTAYFILLEESFKTDSGEYNIEQIELFVEDGMLRDARIETKEGIYFGLKSSKHLLGKHATDKLVFENLQNREEVYPFSKLVLYLPNLNNMNYIPEDDIVPLTKKGDKKALVKDTDLNSLIDVRVYSDFFGLIGVEGNGLVQTEIFSEIGYGTIPIPGTELYVFNYFKPYINVSKFDNDFRSQTITDTIPGLTGDFGIDRMQFNQLSFLQLGVESSILRLRYKQHTFDFLTAGVDYKYSNVFDSTSLSKSTLNGLGWTVGVGVQLKEFKNFGIDFSLKGYWQRIMNSEVKLNNIYEPYVLVSLGMFYYPKGNLNNAIFLRFSNTSSTLEEGYYSQLQFGIKSKLSL